MCFSINFFVFPVSFFCQHHNRYIHTYIHNEMFCSIYILVNLQKKHWKIFFKISGQILVFLIFTCRIFIVKDSYHSSWQIMQHWLQRFKIVSTSKGAKSYKADSQQDNEGLSHCRFSESNQLRKTVEDLYRTARITVRPVIYILIHSIGHCIRLCYYRIFLNVSKP